MTNPGDIRFLCRLEYSVKRRNILISLILLSISGCVDDHQYLNRELFDPADSEIVYEAKGEVALAPGSQPVSAAQISDSAFVYLDKRTRSVVQYDTTTGERHILFELAEYEDLLNPVLAFTGNWGTSLVSLDDGWFLVAAPKRALVAFNIYNRRVQVVGKTGSDQTAPVDGDTLESADFSTFSGIGRGNTGLYVAFDHQIFYISGGNAFNTLIHTPIHHIAGRRDAGTPKDDPNDALRAHLWLDSFAQMVELDGRLYFWDSGILRVISNGRIADITGDGYISPPASLVDFYTNGLAANTPLIAFHNALWSPYLQNSVGMIQILIQSLSMNDYQSEGEVSLFYPDAGQISAWTKFGSQLLTIDTSAETFHLLDTDSLETLRSFENRGTSETSQLIGPTTIAPILDHSAYLVYAPTAQKLSVFTPQTQTVLPLWNGHIDHLLTDGDRRIWFSSGSTFNFLNIGSGGEISHKYANKFFRARRVLLKPRVLFCE